MSLTNPKDVVTEERLHDFYGQLLPYLGGMPEMLANKFSKGDMYSTDEKMIGQWIDGKPLYQRTWETTGDISFDSSDKNIVNLYGIVVDAQVHGSHIAYQNYNVWTDTSTIHVSGTTGTWRITAQYTKTTDSPVSIGSDTDYSTTEKIVGTFIDGKPLYQKTISTNTPASSSETIVMIDSEISDPEVLMLVQPSYCYYNNTAEDNKQYIPISTEWASEGLAAIPNVVISTGKARLNWKVASYWTNKPCVITLQYTKTTD